jgi:acid phosphatase
MLSIVFVIAAAGSALATTTYPSRPPQSTIEPTLTQIEATAATASSLSPLSNVKGVAFDRFYEVFLENTVQGFHSP